MGRTLRSNVVQPPTRSPAKRKHVTARENIESSKKETNEAQDLLDRNILGDQTNTTPSPPKKARLRGRKADADDIMSSSTPTTKSQPSSSESSCKTATIETSVRARRGAKVETKSSTVEKDESKNEKDNAVSHKKTQSLREKRDKSANKQNATDASKTQTTKSVEDVPRASTRNKRTSSLKENDTEALKAEEKESLLDKRRPHRINKAEILSSINESSDEDEDMPTKETESNTKSEKAASKPSFKVSTFYGEAKKKIETPPKVATSETKGPKGCVYKSNEEGEPLAIKVRSENERLALYEFEFDSAEEPKPKKKRKQQQAKPKQAGNSKYKVSGKNTKKTVKENNTAFKPAVTTAPPKIRIITNKVLSSKPVIKASTEVPFKQIKPAIVQKSVKPVYSPNIVPKASLKSKLLTPPNSPPASSISTPELDLPPLMNLFDDDIIATSPSKATTASPRFSRRLASELNQPTGPIRFEYQDIIKARERVVRNNLTPSASPVVSKVDNVAPKKVATPSVEHDNEEQDNTLPAADSSAESQPRLKQTSIRSFLNVKNDDIERIDDTGLFSTGSRSAVEDLPTEVKAGRLNSLNNRMMSSTPQRPGKSRPPMDTFLSPVMGSPVSRLSPSKTRTSPRKVLGTPEKSVHSPIKINEVVRRSPRKLLDSPKKNSPLPLPTRLSLGTLRTAMRTNATSAAAAAPPVPLISNDEFPSLEETKNPPASPSRNFNKPARKSYERRPRKAPQFMELEEDDSEEEEDEEEDNDLLFGDMKGLKSTEEAASRNIPTKHHRKQKDHKVEENNKELDDWASRFNSQLEDVENFELNVE